MAQPLNRNAEIEALGEVDEEAGEFWVESPFRVTATGKNLSAFEPNRLFLSQAGDAFLDASFASNADIESDSRAVVAADFDRDGAEDLLVVSVGGGPLRLFLNRFPPQNRIRLELIGVESNRPAIGTRVEARVGSRRIVRDLFPANGGTGQGPVDLIIGIGSAPRIDQLTLRWPTGKIQTLHDLPANTLQTITEPRQGQVVGRWGRQVAGPGGRGVASLRRPWEPSVELSAGAMR